MENVRGRVLMLRYLLLIGWAVPFYSFAAPYEVTRYVRVDPVHHSAYIYDASFTRLPDNPFLPKTSIDVFPEHAPVWFLGSKVDMVRRMPDGSLRVVSDEPAYYEMTHHFAWLYASPHRQTFEPCSANASPGFSSPLATGSELTDLRLPSGYAFKMDGGALMGGGWHWTNPAQIPQDQEIYLRFVLQFDEITTHYRDTHAVWVDVRPCESDFAIAPGKSSKEGPAWVVDRDMRLVAVHPHVHDHAKYIELRRNGDKLRRFKPEYARVPVAHDDMGQGPTPLHTHKNHLPSEGLSLWTPGVQGPLLRKGDALTAFGAFDNPHDVAIDNMTLFVTFWEVLPAGYIDAVQGREDD